VVHNPSSKISSLLLSFLIECKHFISILLKRFKIVDVFACEDIFSKDFVHLGVEGLRKRFNLCVNRFRALLGSFVT
jgi:hypothetical protein